MTELSKVTGNFWKMAASDARRGEWRQRKLKCLLTVCKEIKVDRFLFFTNLATEN